MPDELSKEFGGGEDTDALVLAEVKEVVIASNDLGARQQQALIRLSAPQQAGDPDVGIEHDPFRHR
jgi:hypothetical protein